MIAPTDAFYPDFLGSAFVLYDLRDPEAWNRAHRERRAWGRHKIEVHTIDNNHTVLKYSFGGALETSAS
jgi:hypothetical protein